MTHAITTLFCIICLKKYIGSTALQIKIKANDILNILTWEFSLASKMARIGVVLKSLIALLVVIMLI